MKKIFLFIASAALAVSMTSCSSDDNSDNGGAPGGTITAKINGVSKTFDNVVVEQETISDNGETYTELYVTGIIGNSTAEIITFTIDAGDVGADAVWEFDYSSGNTFYRSGSMSSVVQVNSDNRLKGNFSGTMTNFGTEETITFADGSFDITY